MDSGRPGPHDPVHYLQLPVSLPVLLPALHFAERWTFLPHWNLPDPCQFVCDERSHHLHGDEFGVGAGGKRLRLLLHPGVGCLPFGAHQRTHLCHLEEARMSHHSIPVFPVTPLPNSKCHHFPFKVKVLTPEYQWPKEPPGQCTQITAMGGVIPKINMQTNTNKTNIVSVKRCI